MVCTSYKGKQRKPNRKSSIASISPISRSNPLFQIVVFDLVSLKVALKPYEAAQRLIPSHVTKTADSYTTWPCLLWPDCDSGWQGSGRRMEWMPMFRGFEAFKFGFFSENLENPEDRPHLQISFSTFRFLNYSEGGFANPSGRSLKHPKTLLESLVRLEKRCPYLRDCICIRPIPGPRSASVFTPELCD